MSHWSSPSLRSTLADVPEWFDFVGMCFECGRNGLLDRAELTRRLGRNYPMRKLELRLRCTVCGARGLNAIGVARKPR